MKAIKEGKAKAKTKKNNARFGRLKYTRKDSPSTSGPDLSQIRKPIDISISSLLQVFKLLETGSDEVKSMLANECDVIYECRVCRNLFRSLANFISHKRVYCREKFNVTLGRNIRANWRMMEDEKVIMYPESIEAVGYTENDNNIQMRESQDFQRGSKKDLTSVVDMLQRKKIEDSDEKNFDSRHPYDQSREECDPVLVERTILLEPMESSPVAMYQTAVQSTVPIVLTDNLMKAQVLELENMMSQNTAVIAPDGHVEMNQSEKSDNPMQIYGSDDDERTVLDELCAEDLICSVCNAKFATRKTLTYHMKTLHMSYRMCYPCPCCTSTFANTWSVYRHLFKLHRKSNDQVRKLRAEIQEKAFRKETTGAEDLEKESASKKSLETTDQQTNDETQEWIEHFELDFELQRCGGCGRRFDRRAALISHSQICQKRIAACNEATNKTKKSSKTSSPEKATDNSQSSSKEASNNVEASLGISATKKACKKPSSESSDTQTVMSSGSVSPEPTPPDDVNENEMTIRVQNVASLSNADWEMINAGQTNGTENGLTISSSPIMDIMSDDELQYNQDADAPISRHVPDSPEIIYTSIDQSRTVEISFGTKKRRVANEADTKPTTGENNEKNTTASTNGNSVDERSTNVRHGNNDHATTMETRIATIANLRRLQCMLCRRKFTSMTNLRRHMAIHIGWNRYRCKLCDFKCFAKCDCVAHCNKIHNAKNNRSIIADMVVQIPQDQNVLTENIVMDITGSDESNPEPELIDVTTPQTPNAYANLNGGIHTTPNKNDACGELVRHEKGAESEKIACASEKINAGEVSLMNQKENDTEKEEATEIISQQPESQAVHESKVKQESHTNKEDDSESHQVHNKLDNDPDLRKMVMEVIFGSIENSSGEDPTKDEIVPRPKTKAGKIVKKKIVKKKESILSGAPKRKYLKRSTDCRPQRPMRNRVKPVDKDFIYDLKDVCSLKESVHRAAVFTANKPSTKKLSIPRQRSAAECEVKISVDKLPKLPELIPCKVPSLVIYKTEDVNGRYGVKRTQADQSTGASHVSSTTGLKGVPVCGEK